MTNMWIFSRCFPGGQVNFINDETDSSRKILSSSCWSKPLWISSFCGKRKMFSRMSFIHTGPQQGHTSIIRALHVTNDLMMLYRRNRLKNISILNSSMNRMNCEEHFYGAFLALMELFSLSKNSTSWTQCIIILLCSMEKWKSQGFGSWNIPLNVMHLSQSSLKMMLFAPMKTFTLSFSPFY